MASDAAQVVVPAPGPGEGFWAGGPSAVRHAGETWLAYRLRRPVDRGRGYANVIARSADGLTFETVATVTSAHFECASLERPGLVRRPDGGWRLYVSCSTPNSKHWWVEAVARAPSALCGCPSLGRRGLVRRPDGGWRLYVSCSPPNPKHWWVEAVDADTPAELPPGERTVVLPGDATEAWKDVIVRADG